MNYFKNLYNSKRLIFLGAIAALLAFSAFGLFYVTDTYASSSAYQDAYANQIR